MLDFIRRVMTRLTPWMFCLWEDDPVPSGVYHLKGAGLVRVGAVGSWHDCLLNDRSLISVTDFSTLRAPNVALRMHTKAFVLGSRLANTEDIDELKDTA